MPIYFAYGANMDIAAMARRCPTSTVIGPARLMNHRFFIMRAGVASVRRAPGSVVHGLLWTLSQADVRPLDRFEEVAGGLYAKVMQPVVKRLGAAQALVYVGHTLDEGPPRPGYLEAVIASARAIGLPDTYVRALSALQPPGSRSGAGQSEGPVPSWPGLAEVSSPNVRPRFATPIDRT